MGADERRSGSEAYLRARPARRGVHSARRPPPAPVPPFPPPCACWINSFTTHKKRGMTGPWGMPALQSPLTSPACTGTSGGSAAGKVRAAPALDRARGRLGIELVGGWLAG